MSTNPTNPFNDAASGSDGGSDSGSDSSSSSNQGSNEATEGTGTSQGNDTAPTHPSGPNP